jgi:hypothetical protein
MAYAENRSRNGELGKGMRDGSTYSDTPNRGGATVSAPTGQSIRLEYAKRVYRANNC